MRRVVTHIGIFAVTLARLWALLTLAASIPNARIRDNMLSSALYYGDVDAFQFENSGRLNAVSDHYADCILLGVSYYMGEGDPLLAALDTKYYRGEADGIGVNTALYATVADGAAPDTDYTRYWHGMAAFVRMIHLFGNVETVKQIGFAAMLIFACLTLGMLLKRKSHVPAIALTAALLCVQIWNVRLSMEYQSVFVLCFLLCPLYLSFERKNEKVLTLLSVMGGTATAFFDFLTCETVVLLLPLLLVVAVRIAEKRLGTFRDGFRLLFACGICFFAAYAATFLCKWTLASLFTGENKFALALTSAELHTLGDGTASGAPSNTLVRILLAPIANLTALFGGKARVDGLRVALWLLLAVAVLGSAFYLFQKKNTDRSQRSLLLLPGAVVFLRYAVLNYHSYMHAFFTYRALLAPIFAVFVSLLFCMERPHRRKEVRKK